MNYEATFTIKMKFKADNDFDAANIAKEICPTGMKILDFNKIFEEPKIVHCRHCEEIIADGYDCINSVDLCEECDDKYDNKTGHCSLSCCIDGECDESC